MVIGAIARVGAQPFEGRMRFPPGQQEDQAPLMLGLQRFRRNGREWGMFPLELGIFSSYSNHFSLVFYELLALCREP